MSGGRVYLRRTVGRKRSGFRDAAISPDDRWIAAGAEDGCVWLFEVGTGRKRLLEGHSGEVRSVAWSPDGTRLISGADDVRIWDTARGTARVLDVARYPRTVAWSPYPGQVACAGLAGVQILSAENFQEQHRVGDDLTSGWSVAWSHDGEWLASGHHNGTLLVWSTRDGKRRILGGAETPISRVAFSPKGGLLASVSEDGGAWIWNTVSDTIVLTTGAYSTWVHGAAWSPDGRWLALASGIETVQLWDPVARAEKTTAIRATSPSALAWSHDGTWLAVCGRDAKVRLWSVGDWKLLEELNGHAGSWSIAASPGNQRVAWASGNEIRIHGATIRKISAPVPLDSTPRPAWAPDGNHLAVALGDKLLVCNANGNEKSRMLHRNERISSLAWSPDGKSVAFVSNRSTVRVWTVESGECSTILDNLVSPTVVWAADGESLACAAEGRLVLKRIDSKPGVTLFDIQPLPVRIAFAPKDALFAVGLLDGTVGIWQGLNNAKVRAMEGHRTHIISMAWSRDGALLATMSWDSEVRLWRAADGALLDVLPKLSYRFEAGEITFADALPAADVYGADEVMVDGWAPSAGEVRSFETVVSAKVAFVGESEAGKSCLALRFAKGSYRAVPTTHGMQIWPLKPKRLDANAAAGEGEAREIVLWDLGGQRHYQLIHQLFLPDTRVALVLLDPTRGEKNFEEVEDWNRRLERAEPRMRKLLVRSKADLGGVVDERRVRALVEQCKFDGYLEVSAKTNKGTAQLGKRILELVDWDSVVKVTRTAEFQAVHEQIKEARRRQQVVLFERDLKRAVEGIEQGHIDAVVGQLSRQGQLVDLRAANGERVVVLRVDVVDKYAGSLILLAKEHPRGVPVLEQRSLLALRSFPGMDGKERVSGSEERIILESVADLFVARGIAIQHAGLLVFPSEFPKETAPDISDVPFRKPLYYDFDGPLDNIWAALAANLAVSGEFGPVRLWANRAEYEKTGHGTFGMYLREVRRGCGHLDVYFSEETEQKQRDLFITYVDDHLREHGVRLAERLGITCTCQEVLKEEWFRNALARGESELKCPKCGTAFPVLGGAEAVRGRAEVAGALRALKTKVEEGTRRAAQEAKHTVARGAAEAAAEEGAEPVRILHLSDLHFTGAEGVWGLLQPLASDLRDTLKADRIDYLVASGDFADKCQDLGFDLAEQFLRELIREFGLSADRLILCPGNHDVNRGLKVYQYEEQRPAGYADAEVVKLADGGFLVRDRLAYPKRFERFGKMYHNLLQRPYPAALDEQGVLIPYPEAGIEFLTLNTAWEIDGRFPDRATVNLDAMGKALMASSKTAAKLRIAVWHHAVRAQRQVANQDVISGLVKAGFRLCLHGDIHEEAAELVGWMRASDKKGLYVVGTGSFGSGGEGTPRLYSLLEVDRNFGRVVVHMRAQRRAGGAFGAHAVAGSEDADHGSGRYEIAL